jgi:hypothetical protein
LVVAVTTVLIVLILARPTFLMVNLTVLTVLTVLVMVVANAEKYLAEVLRIILSVFHHFKH